jgi:hypothetical protein
MVHSYLEQAVSCSKHPMKGDSGSHVNKIYRNSKRIILTEENQLHKRHRHCLCKSDLMHLVNDRIHPIMRTLHAIN